MGLQKGHLHQVSSVCVWGGDKSDESKRRGGGETTFSPLFMSIITVCPCHAVKWKLSENVCTERGQFTGKETDGRGAKERRGERIAVRKSEVRGQ